MVLFFGHFLLLFFKVSNYVYLGVIHGFLYFPGSVFFFFFFPLFFKLHYLYQPVFYFIDSFFCQFNLLFNPLMNS